MTRQESFKKRIRARMTKTGERYAAARRSLIDASARDLRTWAAQPEMSEQAVADATGHGWNAWCDVIEAWPDHSTGHAAIAAHLQKEHDVDGWWAQTITVGYERIVGLRRPYQRADGTFTANKSKTVNVDADELRALLLSHSDRNYLFPGVTTELRSGPMAKTIRVELGPGIASLRLTAKDGGRVTVAVAHDSLPTYDDVEEWKFYWGDWLDALDQG